MLEKLKNKKILFGLGAFLFLILYYFIFLGDNSSLSFSAEDLKVKTIDSKQDFEDIIIKNIYEKIQDSCEPEEEEYTEFNGFERQGGMMLDTVSVNQGLVGASNDGGLEMPSFGGVKSMRIVKSKKNYDKKEEKIEDVSFSQTNIQKTEVDEGDILKQTKDYIFYYSREKSEIFIIKSPIKNHKINLKNSEIVDSIPISNNLTINPELFVNDTRLVYLASKKAYNNHSTIVGVYDISDLKNGNLELLKIFETKGEYFKSRLINNKLYLISDFSLSPFTDKFCNIIKKEKNSFFENLSFFTGIDFGSIGINEVLYNELKEELESFSYKLDSINDIGDNIKLDNFKIFYTNKDLKESIENLNFNIISVVDIDSELNKTKQTLIFGNLKNGEIHMTLDNLYLVNSYHRAEKWKCDYIDICYKEFASNNFSSISKISYRGEKLKYLKTAIIPGKPLNQYSMDEDEGYFRIFTAKGSRNSDASLYVFDKKLRVVGELENIKPGEEFKSSRFIGDKAFLVTFRQRDPLFVIDLHIPAKPKIIGELHIPGYSSYLHPYGTFGNKQYLIGIGKDDRSVKVDLYKIDYSKKGLGDNIYVKQEYSYIFDGYNSETPAKNNPRSFVWDKKDKLLYLPIKIDGSNYFKVLKIDKDLGISEDKSYKAKNSDINNSRVGYYKFLQQKALFYVSDYFITFFDNLTDNNKTFKFR